VDLARADRRGGRLDNLWITRLDTGDSMLVYCSFLTSCHCPENHLAEIVRRVTEESDGDEQETDVWRHQAAEAEMSDENGNRTAAEDGSTAGVAGSEPRAAAVRGDQGPAAGETTGDERPEDGDSWARARSTGDQNARGGHVTRATRSRDQQ
jgi:hypothetical protein